MTAETGRPHTAILGLPLHVEPSALAVSGAMIVDNDKTSVATIWRGRVVADSMALSCNLFPALVAALEDAERAVLDCHEWRSHNHHSELRAIRAILSQARSAPSLAGE